jgi:chitodextrinase
MNYLLSILIIISGTGALTVHAAESTFEIEAQIISSDSEAPTAPTGLTGTVVSTSQINLSWNPSTDNVAVTNYRIYRDLVNIATTSSTTYSDTGLLQDTAYSYTVTAIDAVYNESLHSATTTATTTLPIIPPTTGGGGRRGGGSYIGSSQLVVENLQSVSTETSIVLTWTTPGFARAKVSWGATLDYELGTTLGAYYERQHAATIGGLLPGKTYYMRIEMIGGFGATYILENIAVATKDLPDTTSPSNPWNFHATKETPTGVLLTWKNPNDADFAAVRIVRSTKSFPVDIIDGKIVYEGVGELVRDEITAGQAYYYTIFAKDARGNYSSGAVARIAQSGSVLPVIPVTPVVPVATTSPVVGIEIQVIQEGVSIPIVEKEIQVETQKTVVVAVPASNVSGDVKLVVATVLPKGEKEGSSYILSLNKETNRYETRAQIETDGEYELIVSFLGHKGEYLLKQAVKLNAETRLEDGVKDSFLRTLIKGADVNAIALTLLIALLLVIGFLRLIMRTKRGSFE